jgi:hypothetical protein
MNKYHLNLNTGDPGLCRAKRGCPFGGPQAHYDSPEAARAAYEASAGETVNSHRRELAAYTADGYAPDNLEAIRNAQENFSNVLKKWQTKDTLSVTTIGEQQLQSVHSEWADRPFVSESGSYYFSEVEVREKRLSRKKVAVAAFYVDRDKNLYFLNNPMAENGIWDLDNPKPVPGFFKIDGHISRNNFLPPTAEMLANFINEDAPRIMRQVELEEKHKASVLRKASDSLEL